MSNIVEKMIDYTNKDYESFRSSMISLIPTKTPDWTDTSESDQGIVILELMCYALDILSFYQDRYANESYLPTATLRSSVINLCSLVGYILAPASPSTVTVTFTFSAALEAPVVIPAGFQVGTKRTETEDSVIFEVLQSTTVNIGETTKDVVCVQGYSVYNEVLGSGTNTADQEFALVESPVIIDATLALWIKEGSVWNKWTKVSDFIYSTSEDRHYVVTVDEDDFVTLTFGNGVNGAKVPLGTNNVKADYRVGGGVVGNVGSATITEIISGGLPSLSSVSNAAIPYVQGIDKESIESAKAKAPRYARTRDTLVTTQEFEDYAINYPTIADAQAVVDVSGDHTVYIKPVGGGLPSAELKAGLKESMDLRRVLTVNLTIADPAYDSIDLKVAITILSNYIQAEVMQTVEGELDTYFANLIFAQDVDFGDLFVALKSVEGVSRVTITNTDDTPYTGTEIVDGHIAIKGTITYTPTGGAT